MTIKLTESEVRSRVIKVIAGMLQVFNRDVSTSLTGETKIHDDLGIDSVEMLDLLGALEKEFNMTVETEKVSQVRTVDDMVKFIINV